MTTEIELAGERVGLWLSKKDEISWWDQGSILIADLPDEPGTYDTEFGLVSFRFDSVRNGNGKRSPVIVLDCTRIDILRNRHKKVRIINLTREGQGYQQLSNGVNLLIHTGVNLEGFYG